MSSPSPILDSVLKASAKWRAAFNAGDAAGCAACYQADAVMTAEPFGTFRGREEIFKFWDKLINDGFAQVEYLDEKWEAVDEENGARLSCLWKMNNAKGVIDEELWVVQPGGGALLKVDRFRVVE